MGKLGDAFTFLEHSRKEKTESYIAEQRDVCRTQLERALSRFLAELNGKKFPKIHRFGCVVARDEHGSVVCEMLRLGVSARGPYGRVYFSGYMFFTEAEPSGERLRFQSTGKLMSHQRDVLFTEVRQMTNEEIERDLLTECCFNYLDEQYGEYVFGSRIAVAQN